MKLPNHDQALIPRAKILDYLLSAAHQVGRHKAAFFTQFGFTTDDWSALALALMQHAAEHNTAFANESPFGTRYTVEGELDTPDGRRPVIRTVWFIETGEETPRFVTAYPV